MLGNVLNLFKKTPIQTPFKYSISLRFIFIFYIFMEII